jgi:hypothetical protein
VRRKLAEVGQSNVHRVQHMWQQETPVPEHAAIGARVLAANDPIAIRQLAVDGKDVMTALDMPAGPAVGRILAMLMAWVLDDPSRNTRETLLAEAQRLELEVGR